MTDNTSTGGGERQPKGARRRVRAARVFPILAIVVLGGAVIAFLLLLSARGQIYPYLFGVSAMLALTIGFSAPVLPARPAWRGRGFWVAVATVCFAGLLTASVLLYIALDVDLIRRFCDIVPGNTGDRKLEGNASCNYAYGRMALYFVNFFAVAIAPFVEFVALFGTIHTVRRKFAASAES